MTLLRANPGAAPTNWRQDAAGTRPQDAGATYRSHLGCGFTGLPALCRPLDLAAAARCAPLLRREVCDVDNLPWRVVNLNGFENEPDIIRNAGAFARGRLQMGTQTHLAHLLYWHQRNATKIL